MKKVLLFLFTVLFIVGCLSSCQNNYNTNAALPQNNNEPPIVRPLEFRDVKHIEPTSLKSIAVRPTIKKLDFNKIPVQSYDTSSTRPVPYNAIEKKIDVNNLSRSKFDLDQIPSNVLKLTTFKLKAPSLIKTGQLHLKDGGLSLYELTEAQGLLGNLVTCVFTDKKDFEWIATDKGLYRYDGENLLSYLSGVPDRLFVGMLEDASGRIWLATINGGLAILDQQNNTLSEALPPESNRGELVSILQDKQHRIWETTSLPDGISVIDPEKLLVKKLNRSNGIASGPVNSITIDHSGQIWASTLKGIYILNNTQKTLKVISKADGLNSDSTGALFCDRAGNIWISNKGINIFNPLTNSFKTIKGPDFVVDNPLTAFNQDKNNRIWISSQKKGIGIADPSKQVLQNIKKTNGLADNFTLKVSTDREGQAWVPTLKGLNKLGYDSILKEHIGNQAVSTLSEDKQGLIWQGGTKGVTIFDRKNKTYRYFGLKQGLCNDTIQCISELNNKMFICSNGGIDIVDSARTTITHLGVNEGLGEANIDVSMVDNHGNIWIGGANKGLYIYNPLNFKLIRLDKVPGLVGLAAADIKQDKRGNVWVSNAQGIYKISGDLKVIENLPTTAGSKALLVDDQGKVWIGSRRGIFIADEGNKKVLFISKKQGLIDEHVVSLLKYNKHVYATTLRGVTIFDPPDRILQDSIWPVSSFGERYGLMKTNTGYFLTDMITRSGLYCWGDNYISVFDLSKRDTTNSAPYISGINIMDGHQYFTMDKKNTVNKLRWDSVSGPYNLPINLQLPYNQNYIQFSYGVLNITPHDTIWYKYRLAGDEKNWNLASYSGFTRNYYNLSPGKYNFELTCKTDNGRWYPPVKFSFTIKPPWWQTWWAYFIYIFLFSGTIWAIVHWRSLKLQQDKRLLEDKVNQRTEEVLQQKEEIEAQRDNLEKAFKELKTAQAQLVQSEKMASLGELTAGIAHEIQNPLNFVNNFSEVNTELIDEMQEELDHGNYEEVKALAGDIKQNQEKISQHGKRADSIVKGMLQHSRTNSGERQLTNVNALADEFFKLSYHGLRAKDKHFNADMVSNFDPDLPKINIVQQDIGRVLLNLFNNAFYAVNEKKKKADKSYKPEVSITTSRDDKHVIIAVKDNGTGIPDAIKEKIMQPFFTSKPTGEGTGLGLSLTYDMVVKGNGGKIEVNTKEGEFTEFVVILPLA